MNNLPVPKFGGESYNNQEPKCLVTLVLDTSFSMEKDPILSLNEGLIQFSEWVKRDPVARKRIEVGIITFDSEVRCIQEPALVDDFVMPTLVVKGTTKMADGIKAAINFTEARKDWYKKNKLDYYRPFVILITDGQPDSDQDMVAIAADIQIGGQGRHFVFMPIGIPTGYDPKLLKDISQPEYPPLPMNWEDFGKFFKWLSKSMGSVSKSAKDAETTFENPDWISKTGWSGGSFSQKPI